MLEEGLLFAQSKNKGTKSCHAIPFFESVAPHPIGLGKTRAERGLVSNGYPFFGS